jgi:AcrR family transcriptional regulator
MDGVAARARVGKATIYRRWRSKHELVQAAVQELSTGVELPDTGSLRGDILTIAALTMQATNVPASTLVPRLMAEATGEPELHEIFLRTLVEPRRQAIAALLTRARQRGEIRPDVDIDLAVDLLIGPLVYRFLIAAVGLEMPPDYPARIVDIALQGLRPSAR